MIKNEMTKSQTPHGENFTLKDFLGKGQSIKERIEQFRPFYELCVNDSTNSYMRKIIKNYGPTVDVQTGESVKHMLMFGSNNYLGLAEDKRIADAIIKTTEEHGSGVGGPPLLNGMTGIHVEFESRLASFKHREEVMLFSSGYQANLAWVQGLVRAGDVVIYDELSHASFFDGLGLASSKGKIHSIAVSHNDLNSYEKALKEAKQLCNGSGQIFLTFEGVYSMDGDVCPLPGIIELAKTYGAFTVMDDAHGTGVLGKSGSGKEEHFGCEGLVDLIIGTFSKAFAMNGGFIAASSKVIQYLRFFARPYMFSAHMPISTVAGLSAGLEIIQSEPQRRERLLENSKNIAESLDEMGCHVLPSDSAIIAVKLPQKEPLLKVSQKLGDAGLFVGGIGYPAVPKSEERIRISTMSTHTEEHIKRLLDVFKSCVISRVC